MANDQILTAEQVVERAKSISSTRMKQNLFIEPINLRSMLIESNFVNLASRILFIPFKLQAF